MTALDVAHGAALIRKAQRAQNKQLLDQIIAVRRSTESEMLSVLRRFCETGIEEGLGTL